MIVARVSCSFFRTTANLASGAKRIGLLSLVATLSGCVSAAIPTLREPTRLYTLQEEMAQIKDQVNPIDSKVSFAFQEDERNNFISLRMYAIDAQYTLYESQLTHETQETALGASLLNLGLTSAASVSPFGETPRVLSAIASAATGASTAYEKDILLSQAIQNLETQMRTDRNTQAAIILANMRCSVRDYPFGLALSDLEEYYRAGTLTNALIGVSRTVSKAETASRATKDAASAAPQVAELGKARLQASADAISSEADSASLSERCSKTTTPKTVRADIAFPRVQRQPPPPPPPIQAEPAQIPAPDRSAERVATAQAICRNEACVSADQFLTTLCGKLENPGTERKRLDAANSLSAMGKSCLK